MRLLVRVLDLQKSKRRISVLRNVKIITNMKQGLMNVLPLDLIHVLNILLQGLITRLKGTTKERS